MAVVAVFHLRQLARPSGNRTAVFTSIEIGHVLMAAGMAVMFAAPHWSSQATWVGWAYAGLGLLFLILVVAHPAGGDRHVWACSSILVVEAFAMVAMTRLGGAWMVGLTGWFVVVFAATGILAAGRMMRFRALPAVDRRGYVSQSGSRVAMSGGMLLMLI